MLTIIASKADNGNEFLCLSCAHGQQRSAQLTENQVICSNVAMSQNPAPVAFRVSQCTGYSNRALMQEGSATYEQFRRTAWYIDASEESSGKLVVLPPDAAKRRGLWYD